MFDEIGEVRRICQTVEAQCGMDVFVSSVISGFEEYRSAAAAAVRALGHNVRRAEDLGASPATPQQACLQLARSADVMVLILGGRYGALQPSGLSATHEEYREAQNETPVLAFVQADVEREPRMAEFVEEVQGWEGGRYTTGFATPEQLRDAVTRRLHEHIVATESLPLDEGDLLERARALLPSDSRSFGGTPLLIVATSAGPKRAVLRPSELTHGGLHDDILAVALIGNASVLSSAHGTSSAVVEGEIRFEQDQTHRLTVTEHGSVFIVQPAVEEATGRAALSAIIDEDIAEKIRRCVQLTGLILERIDPIHRLSYVAPVVALTGSEYLPWRTAAEQEASPNAYTLDPTTGGHRTVELSPPVRRRPELMLKTDELASDLVARLRLRRRRS